MFALRTIRSKLIAAFAAVTLLTLLVGAFGLRSLGKASAQLDVFADQRLPTLQDIAKVQSGFLQARLATLRAIIGALQDDAAMVASQREPRDAAYRVLEEGLKNFRARPKVERELELWKVLEPGVQFYRAENERLWAALDAHDPKLAAQIMTSFVPAVQHRVAEPLTGLVAVQEALSKEENDTSDAMVASTNLVFWLVMAAAVVVAGLLGFLLSRSVAGGIGVLVGEAGRLRQAVAEGRLGERGDEEALGEEFRPVLAGINETMDAFQRPIQVTVDYITRLSNGDIPPRITEPYQGDFDAIKTALNRCIDSISGLVTDMKRVADAQEAGDLEALVETARYAGAYRTLAGGVNAGLQLHVRNLLEILEIVRAYAEGDFSPELRTLPGKQIIATQRMALLRGNLRSVSSDVLVLSGAAVEGRLSTRLDVSRSQGDWKKLAAGVNATLDAVVGPLNVAARYVDEISRGAIPAPITERYAGDFNGIKDSLNRCIGAVDLLVADTGKLVEAAVAGRLQTRADATKHLGDFRKVVEGVNQTLDAVLEPIGEAAGVLEKLAQRDLRARMAGSYQGDHATIKESINATGEALQEALAQVASAVEQVSSASTQIASSSQAVASGASEQASSLQETSSSLESVLAITRQATDNAQQANALATAARGAASEGSAAVEQMQGAMVKIKASAEGTSQIIRDINDIAFQTNLLALNAAVEAARAGEAGRGFAVVAEEVRSLALRAKEAAMKTEELIRQSVVQAGEGELRSRQVAGKLGEIVAGIGKVSDIVSEMAVASKAQMAGIDQVNRAVAEMDRVTQQNAASAEESSSAASELSGQSEELAAMVGAFQLSRAQAGGGAGQGRRGVKALPSRQGAIAG